jgi:hypothetical protein
LYCVSFGLRLLITPWSFSCLYVLSIVLCVLRFTSSDYTFKLFLSLCSCHCIVCPSVYGFWLPRQAFLVFMFLPLYCVSFGVWLLVTPSSFSCLYVLAIVLCVLRFTASGYPFKLFSVFMFLSLYCVSFGLRLLITPSIFSCLYVLTIVYCVLLFTASDYPLKLFLSLCSCHCIVCPSVYGFWLSLQAFLVFMFFPLYIVSFCLRLLITPSNFSCLYVLPIVLCVLRFTASDYPFKLFFVFMFLQLYCVFFGVRLLITPSSFSCLYVLTIVLCVLRFTASHYPLKLFLSLCSFHCIVCPSLYRFWLYLQSFLVFMFLPLYIVSFCLRLLITPSSFSCLYVLAIVLCVLRFTASHYPLKLFLSLCSCHCIVCPSLYLFWLHL